MAEPTVPKPTKEGHLYKYRNVLKGWEYRYFKLSRDYFHYYSAQHAPTPKKTLVRSEIVSATPCSAFPSKHHCFQLDARSSERWYMQASSESEMRSWITALTAHLPPTGNQGDSTKTGKELEAEGSTAEVHVPLPPLPSYMKEVMNEPPPSYDQCVDTVYPQS